MSENEGPPVQGNASGGLVNELDRFLPLAYSFAKEPHDLKKCTVCKQSKSLTEFWAAKRGRYGVNSKCKVCQKATNQSWKLRNPDYDKLKSQRYKLDPQHIWVRIRHHAGRRGVAFDLNRAEFVAWWIAQPPGCMYCGLTNAEASLISRMNNRAVLSVDRKDNELPYRLDNIGLACQRCNFIKSDFFSYEDMLSIADQFIKPKLVSR